MKAHYNSVKWFMLVILAVLAAMFNPLAYGGGLDRVMVTGPTGVGNGSDPDGIWLLGNLACQIQLPEDIWEAGIEVMAPKFRITDRFGRTIESKNVAHGLPWFYYGTRVDEDRVYGLQLSTLYGMGASFEKPFGRIDSRTLISGTYVKPFVAQRLNDEWSVGASIMLVNAMMTWHAPFDLNRRYLPVEADTEAIGYGVGYEVGLMYQPTDNLAFGLDYMSAVECDLSGRTEILSPFKLRDEIETSFGFPDRLTLSAAWKPTDRWLLTAEWSYYGYSKNSLSSIDVEFEKLRITKPVTTNWGDNFTLNVGASRKFNERLTLGGGLGYMSKSVNDETVDFLTPDVAGYGVAGRMKYDINDSFSLTAAVSYGWGSNKADGKEISAEIFTGCITGTVKF